MTCSALGIANRRSLLLLLGLTLGMACGDGSVAAPQPASAPPASTSAPHIAGAIADGQGILPAPHPVRLPADDGAHDARLEWWYYNGHVESTDGRRYSFHLVVFKRQSGAERSAYVAHVSITDHQRGAYQFSEQLSVPPPQKPQAAEFDLLVGAVQARGGDGAYRLRGGAQDYRLELELDSAKPAVLHGVTGFIGLSGSEASYYYSRTGLRARGMVVDHGEPLRVTGIAWMDHQWGDFTLEGEGGWDWFGIQLQDSTEVMVSVVRNGAGETALAYGTYIDAAGKALHLPASALRVAARGLWRSPETGATYPSGWTLELPGQGLSLQIDPAVAAQEMVTHGSVGRAYWEGATRVSGWAQGQPIGGIGYAELTGYDRAGEGR
ncbi:MAG: hypothetical protein HYY02_09575 [Chloroflexi bacterium]|nr:hypothetical protein [Chloroflexota bacterium]